MKKKGFCFKRAVSLLLAAVMIVTAAPQTSLTVLAAEQGTTVNDPDVDILTAEDGTDADGDIGDESADVPSDVGAGVGSDEQTGDPDNADQSDNAGDNTGNPDGINQGDDAGDSGETETPEENVNVDVPADGESVSENDVAGVMSVFGNESGEGEDGGPSYKGEIIDDEMDGTSYRRLLINEAEAEENNVEIAEILTYYAKQIEAEKCAEFNCVQFDVSASSFSIKKDYINGARSILDKNNSDIGYWIDYNFRKEEDDSVETYSYSISKPEEMTEDLDATFTVELIPAQGVKINVKTTEFSAESVSVSYDVEKEDAFAECWDNAEQEDLRLLALNGNDPTEFIEQNVIWYSGYDYKNESETIYCSNFGIDINIQDVQAGQVYLITPLYADKGSVAKGGTKELTAGERSGSSDGAGVSDVAWESLDESLITIEAGEGAAATLTATDKMGEAYYYVTYKRDGKDWLELHSIQVAYVESDGTLAYVGEVVDDEEYLRLCIDEAEATEKNKGKDITDILNFYEDKELRFSCVEFNMMDASPNKRVVKKDYINGALSVMNTENGGIGYWIDYNFRNDDTDTGVSFSLVSPYKAGADVKATFTLTELQNQGLKVKFASTAFPAERVSLNYNLSSRQYADSFKGSETQFRLFTHSSGTPKAMVDINEEQGWGHYGAKEEGTSVSFENIKPLGTTEYLAASIYEDENRPVVGGEPVQLVAGTRADVPATSATSVTWMSLDTDKATIDKNGKLTAWSDEGEIYYYVKYKVGKTQYLEVHEMHAQSQDVNIEFAESEISMELDMDPDAEPNRKYLRLCFYPSDAECDLCDLDRLRWEITENGEDNDNPVIDFVYYYYDEANRKAGDEVEWGEDGKQILPEGMNGVTYGGNIIALNEGTATVKVSYLGDQVDKEENKIPIETATCTVKVVKPFTWEEMSNKSKDMNLYAVTDLDTKLSDIALDTGWKWEAPDTSLANFKGMDRCRFPAVYKDEESGKTFNALLEVRFVTVTGIEIDGGPDSIGKDKAVTLQYSYRMDNLDGDFGNENSNYWVEYNTVKKRMEENYQIEWTSNPATTVGSNETYLFTAPASINKATKYTVTVSVKDKKNKVYLKNSCAITVTVTENPEFKWNQVEGPWTDTDNNGQMRLNYRVRMPKDEYDKQQLTIVSEDTAILKLTGKAQITQEQDEVPGNQGETEMVTYVRIPCNNLKPGTAWIKVTAADEIKSVKRHHLEFIDKEPKLIESAVTINQALINKSAEVTVRTHMQYPIVTDNVALQLNGKDTDDITASVTGPKVVGSGEDQYNDYNIQLILKEDASVKKGKHKVTLKLDVTDGTEKKTYPLNLTLNVTNTVPKVTFKQAKKVNFFYIGEEGRGILNVTGADIKGLSLEGCGFKVEQMMVDQDPEAEPEPESELEPEPEPKPESVPVPGVYYISQVGDVNSKKGTLSYTIEGYSEPFKTNFTVSTENKKPTIVLSQKSDTLYPMAGYENSWLWMTDKATGDKIVPDTVTYVDTKNKIEKSLEIELDDADWDNHTGEWNITKKEDYNLLATTKGDIAFMLQPPKDSKGYQKKTDKFSLEIQKENWNEPVTISYSIKVDTAKPKLVLGKSTLTLNKNEAVYRAQQERTSLHLKGTSDAVYQGNGNWVRFDGQDEKSKKILRSDNSLVLSYWDEQGDVVVRFNDNSMEKGTYKFKVSVGNEWVGLVASTVLTVKIVDVSIEKTLKVTAKGSIDVMNKEGTSIAYTPKISNISGKVVNGWLEGMDSNLFMYDWDGSKLIVKATGWYIYNTKHTYRVRAVFEVETEDYDSLTVSTDAAKPLTIKVKQGKPTLKATTNGNIIYRQLDNTVDIMLSAMLNKQEVEIDDVWLLNFTDDLELIPTEIKKDPYIYNPETKSVRLGLKDRHNAVDVIKSGKTCKVKLAVRYRDKAGNEKAAEVTCPIVVR